MRYQKMLKKAYLKKKGMIPRKKLTVNKKALR
jgi:hypothetical protein